MRDDKFDYAGWLWLIGLTVFAIVANTLLVGRDGTVSSAVLYVSGGMILVSAILFVISLLRNTGNSCRFALFLTFLVGLWTAFRFSYLYSSHDLGTYFADEQCVYDGHLGMIYWFAHNLGFPTMNPLEEGNSILMHPPLYHMIGGLFMRVMEKGNLNRRIALENLQIVNLFFAQGSVLLTGELLRLLGVSRKRRAIGMLFVGLMPIIPLLAAVPNNDMLCMLLMVLCMYSTVCWIYRRKLSSIIAMGLSLGFAMASKLNAALLIPPITLVFVLAFFQNLKSWRVYIRQYIVFLLVSIPEAVAWPLYHFLDFQVPIGAIRSPDLPSLAEFSAVRRFLCPYSVCFKTPYFSLEPKESCNIWVNLLKTTFLDEQAPAQPGSAGWVFSYFLLALLSALLIYAMVRTVMILARKYEIDSLVRLFFAVVLGIGLVFFIRFNVQFPYVCTANARYLLYFLPILSIGLVISTKKARKKLDQ